MNIVILVSIVVFGLIMFFVINRELPGQGYAQAHGSDIKGLEEFEEANPTADHDIKVLFHNAVAAHRNDNFEEAHDYYNMVLESIEDEPITLHNLALLPQ